jgi:LmbE family N-acetylglucosaminyl deacetylase
MIRNNVSDQKNAVESARIFAKKHTISVLKHPISSQQEQIPSKKSSHQTKSTTTKNVLAQTVVVFCAHPDDEALGVGGTIAKYTQQGVYVVVVLFTDGESSHPFHKKEYVQKIRREEIAGAGKLLGVSKIIHLGLRDGSLSADIKKPLVKQLLVDILEQYSPQKVFTHSRDDMLYPDHVAVHKSTLSAVKEYLFKHQASQEKQTNARQSVLTNSIKTEMPIHEQEKTKNFEQKSYQIDVFTFNIWGMTLFDTFAPQLVVDITESFEKKIRAIEQFKSQKLAIAQLLPTIVYKAVQAGSKINVKYAESFRKIRL